MTPPTCTLDGDLVDDLTVIGDLTVRLEMLGDRHAHLAIYRRGDDRNRVAVSVAARRRSGRVVLELIPMEGIERSKEERS